ncbi:uncharacterized protein LOC116395011 [Anarrhichthys ocellatus]|uniref:uncharacterized protein LOC116395011 n=1 Tax=Anarrhichthys ocellatus TaxID=433405 RepID=UPI0012ECE58F|nr:uncharacterized protein LOC116395011 [Anarrhichthys ocellatus]
MEMWLKRSTLVLLTAALVISDQALVILNETRTTVKVPLGSSVTFQCRLKIETHGRLRVIWFLNPSSFESHNLSEEIFSKSAKNSSLVSNKTMQDYKDEGQDTEGTWPTYILSNATEQDSGWYFCRVTTDIPILKHINSSGTEVVITTVSPMDNFTLIDQWMWITLGVSIVILIVLLVICVLLRRRRHGSREEDPVYANTRPVANKQPSPRPGMDHLKAVSSSQNPRNPSPGRKYDEGKLRYK